MAGVHSLDSDEVLNSLLVSVCISEDNLGKWRSSAWIVDDVLHNTLDVSVSKKLSVGTIAPRVNDTPLHFSHCFSSVERMPKREITYPFLST